MMDEYDTLKAQTWIDKYKVATSTHPQGALFKNIAQVRNPRLLSRLRGNADFIHQITIAPRVQRTDNTPARPRRFFPAFTLVCCEYRSYYLDV
jgi:hypothetical protein